MQGKKSFLLYCDMIHVFEELSDEQAGKLIKLIFDYVNDKNPIIDDQILKVSFAPIKAQLKRDLQEWLEKCERNKKNGEKGGRPPKPKKPSGFSGNRKNPNEPDNDNDTDNDNVNDNDLSKEEIHKRLFRELKESTSWMEQFCMNQKCTMQEAEKHLVRFYQETVLKGEFKEEIKELKNHFINWTKKGNGVQKIEPENKSSIKDNWW